MQTFLEVYETLVAFVNFKLFSDIGLVYPPRINQDMDEQAMGLDAYILESNQVQTTADGKESKIEDMYENLPQPVVEPSCAAETIPQLQRASNTLFKNMSFYLSRETPSYSLSFIVKAFQGTVVPTAEGATHIITDRLGVEGGVCEMLQPQWIYDCINAKELLGTEGYHPGQSLPAHLSPFVTAGEYDYNPAEEEKKEEVEEEKEEEKEKKEGKELAKMMMSKRDKKLYDKIQFGQKRKMDVADNLRRKKGMVSK